MSFINTAGMKKKNNIEYMKAILHNTEYANSKEYKEELEIERIRIREKLFYELLQETIEDSNVQWTKKILETIK